MLKGWQTSEGANEELDFAIAHNYTILFEERFNPLLQDPEEYQA